MEILVRVLAKCENYPFRRRKYKKHKKNNKRKNK